MFFRASMTILILAVSLLPAIGGMSLLSDGRTTLGTVMLATAVVVGGTGVATWRWSRELTP